MRMESAIERKRMGTTESVSSSNSSCTAAMTAATHRKLQSDSDDDEFERYLKDEFDEVEEEDVDVVMLLKKKNESKRKKKRLRKSSATFSLWTLRQSFPRIVLLICMCWVLCFLLWIRWPIFHRLVVPHIETWLGDGREAEVEPLVVMIALVVPFFITGTVFYWKEHSIGSIESWQTTNVMTALRQFSHVWKRSTLDSVDLLLIGGFALVQINLLVGKLLMDHQSGKLAKAGYLDRTARAFGMNGLYALVLSILLVSRQSFLHKFFRLSGERAAQYHVWMGNFGFFVLMLHGVLYSICWYQQGKLFDQLVPCIDSNCSPKETYRTLRNFFGLVALLLLLIVAVGSLERVRRNHFQRFSLIHCINVLFVVFTALHYYPTAFWLLPAIVVYVMYRVVSAFGRGQASVISSASLSDKIVQLELRRDAVNAKNGNGRDFEPGQYVYIKVDAIGRRWHPFSICSSPLQNHHSFHLAAKVHGLFTLRLLELMKAHKLSSVKVDGYYGSKVEICPHMVFVAGGSGMTPFLSVLEHLKLLVEATPADDQDEIDMPKTLWIIWTCRDAELFEAYGDLLQSIKKSSRWKSKIWLHLTSTADEEDTEMEDSSLDGSSPRVERFYPSAMQRFAFSGGGHLHSLSLFIGICTGCLLFTWAVYTNEMLTSTAWSKRFSLLCASIVGAATAGGCILYVLQRIAKAADNDGRMGEAMGEIEYTGLDISSPMAPATPRQFPTPAATALVRNFTLATSRPDLPALLRSIHGEVQEDYGMNAQVGLFVSGPSSLQADVLKHARILHSPHFSVHQKSFTV